MATKTLTLTLTEDESSFLMGLLHDANDDEGSMDAEALIKKLAAARKAAGISWRR